MDISLVKTGRVKSTTEYWNAEEAKLVFAYGEDHNTVRAKGIEYYVEAGKYYRTSQGVLLPVEGREGEIKEVAFELTEEAKTDAMRAEEAKLVINFGEDRDEVARNGVEHYIESGRYYRNQYGVLLRSVEGSQSTNTPLETKKAEVEDLTHENIEEKEDNTIEEEVLELEDMDIEDLRTIYEDVMGKPISTRYKNDREFMIGKIQSV